MESTLISESNFVVVDIETTGSKANDCRIIELAFVLVTSGEKIHSYTSLINPHQFIPPFITSLTGITNAHVITAPDEHEVLKRLWQVLQLPNAVFVAHNVSFDWGFVKAGFLRCGLPVPEIPVLCTCKLSRRLVSGNGGNGLDALIKKFGIQVENRHRALGDTEATVFVLQEFLEVLESDHQMEFLHELLRFQNTKLAAYKPASKQLKLLQPYLDSIPDEPGIYRMVGRQDEILYIGKAKVLRDRVRSYFQLGAQLSGSIREMVGKVHCIKWECTDTELGALLLESRLIKECRPQYNTASKRLRQFPFIRLTGDDFPKAELCYQPEQDGAEYFGPFKSRRLTNELLDNIRRQFDLRLCNGVLSPSEKNSPCFYHYIKKCGAPCALKQSVSDYAVTVSLVKKHLSGYSDNIVADLQKEMRECSERLQFEDAIVLRSRILELQQVFYRKQEVASSLHNNNVVLVLPASARDKTVEVFLVRNGLVVQQKTFGRKAPLTDLFLAIEQTYFVDTIDERLSKMDVDSIKIITQWMFRHRNEGTFVYVEKTDHPTLCEQVQSAIRSTYNDEVSKNSNIEEKEWYVV